MRVFISHPYADDPKGNFKKADKICKELIKQDITPISPLHLFSFYDNDENRAEIMAICKSLIDISDEVWIYGNSEGCMQELKYAKEKGKPIKYKGA